MARRFTESFELGHMLRFAVVGAGVGATDPGIDGGTLAMHSGASNTATFVPSASSAEFYAGWFTLTTNVLSIYYPIFWLNGATELGGLHVNAATGILEAFVGDHNGVITATYSSSKVMISNTTYHIQVHIKIDDTVGVIEVKVDNTPVLTQTGIDTKPGSATVIDRFTIGFSGGNTSTDSICVNDTTGLKDNSWTGVVRMRKLAPIGNGFYATGAWSKNTGAAEWDHVEEIPPDNDTTYLSTTSANTYSSFSMADQSLIFANYQAVTVSAVVKKDSGVVNLGVGFRIGGNDYIAGVSNGLPVTYGVVEGRLTEDPSTSLSWQSAGINSAEALIFST